MTVAEMTSGDSIEYPACWLIHALEWSGGDLAEGAHAVPPDVARTVATSTEPMSADLDMMLEFAAEWAKSRGIMTVFVSDLTAALAAKGYTWADLGVPDVEAALTELRGRTLGLYLTISAKAHLFIADAAETLVIHGPGGSAETTRAEREWERTALRNSLTDKLMDDWPAYIRDMRARGMLRA